MQKDQLKEQLTQALAGIAPKDATPQQLHQAIGDVVMHNIAENWNKSTQAHETNRHACYFSMEFLVGRAVFNNLLCLGCYKEVETALQEIPTELLAHLRARNLCLRQLARHLMKGDTVYEV